MEHQHFSFFPFGVLYCLTLFSFLTAFLVSRVMFRRHSDRQPMDDAEAVLKYRFASGEVTEDDYLRLKELLHK
jgi:uncharacterized membrane protein